MGRAKSSDVRIPLSVVSSRHLRLQYSAGGWTITDLQSTNGTLLGGNTLIPHQPVAINDAVTAVIGEVSIDLSPGDLLDSITLTESGMMTRQLVADAILSNDASSARVSVQTGPEASKVFVLENASFLVGSSEHAQIHLDGPASVFSILQNDALFVLSVDVDPARVTINGEHLKTSRQTLGSSEVITFENLTLLFEDPLAGHLQDVESAKAGATTDAEPPNVGKAHLSQALQAKTSPSPPLVWLILAILVFVLAAVGLGVVFTI